MGTFKEALLFYEDGQVKFTRNAVSRDLQWYQETFVEPLEIPEALDSIPVSSKIHKKHFIRVADTERYAIYEELRCDRG